MIKISALIITFNEEKNIERCLSSIREIADEIVVVDSYSTDNTEQICKSHNVRFIQNEFKGHIEQKNFALDQATHPYVLSLDADEALSDELIREIKKLKLNWSADAYAFNRYTNYCGQWIKHCGWYPDRKLRLAIREKVRWCGENPHDRLDLTSKGDVGYLQGDLLHYPFYTIAEHITQINKFTDIRAAQMLKKGKRASLWGMILRSFFKFFKSYFIKLGFLDGMNGFIICSSSSFAVFLRYAKLWQLSRVKL